MTQEILTGSYYLSSKPDEKIIGAVVDQLLKYGCKYEPNEVIEYYLMTYNSSKTQFDEIADDKLKQLKIIYNNITDPSVKHYLEFTKEFELKDYIYINLGLNERKPFKKVNISTNLFTTDYERMLGGSIIRVSFYSPPFRKLTKETIDEWTHLASLIYRAINIYNPIKFAHWLSYLDNTPDYVSIGRVGWITIFPPYLTTRISKDKLLKAPALRIEEIAEDTIMLLSSDNVGVEDEFRKTDILANYLNAKDGVLKID